MLELRRLARGPMPDVATWLMLVGVTFLPGAVFYAQRASSHAAGASLAAALSLLLFGVHTQWRAPSKSREWKAWVAFTVLTLLFVVLHAAIASLWLSPVVARPLQSLLPLALIILGGGAAAALMRSADPVRLDRTLLLVLVMLLVAWFAGRLRLQPLYALYAYHKAMFPYTEPSHLALTLLPFFLYACVQSRGLRQFGWLVALTGITLATQNVTFAVGCLLVLAIASPLRFFVPIAIAAGVVLSQIDLYYFIERINVATTLNTSTLVFFQGWELMFSEWRLSHGWGIGFQQLGLHGHLTPASHSMIKIEGAPRNTLDGGFAMAKLVSEFGFGGLLVALLYAALAAMFAWQLRRHSPQNTTLAPAVIFARCVFVTFSIEFFVRGMGYFSAGTLLLAMACWILWHARARR